MQAGEWVPTQRKFSRIVQAIFQAENKTTGEIRVHLSRRWFEPDPMKRARRLFSRFGMQRTSHRNGVLLYVNLRRRLFAIYGDEAIHQAVGQQYWERTVRELRQDLRSTHYENAIAQAVLNIGETLAKFFPATGVGHDTDELPNEVSED